MENVINLKNELAETVAFVVEKTPEFVIENSDKNFFSDLGMDSLIALEIVAKLEKNYSIDIPEERILEISTFDGIVKLISDAKK